MATADHYKELADGLEAAAKAARACAQEEAAEDGETPVEEQSKNLRDAGVRVREHFRRARRAAEQQQK